MAAFLLAFALLLGAAAPRSTPIEHLAWLAGCWQRSNGDRMFEEQWMAARGGMMLGISRTVRAGRVTAYEQMRIYERGDSLVFASHPSGQQPAEFVAAPTSRSVTFANPAHDFPQRVIYAPGPADSLFARIEGTLNGQARGVDFHMQRVSCDAAASAAETATSLVHVRRAPA